LASPLLVWLTPAPPVAATAPSSSRPSPSAPHPTPQRHAGTAPAHPAAPSSQAPLPPPMLRSLSPTRPLRRPEEGCGGSARESSVCAPHRSRVRTRRHTRSQWRSAARAWRAERLPFAKGPVRFTRATGVDLFISAWRPRLHPLLDYLFRNSAVRESTACEWGMARKVFRVASPLQV
jgi:hypothetical protein